ncbi:MAG: protein-methionine-sulfoxide reductase catalytic subunit MsrP [Candidatus Hydrogenedentes bacterium]|nr:protein-methionine-sulfoxide reductase catalytic subunit MsrP [Candidatus Hydrogenedentota bacterium]
MPSFIRRPSWYLPDSAATGEDVFFNRRDFLKAMGIGGMMAGGLSTPSFAQETAATSGLPLPEYARNPKFAHVGRALTEEYVGTTFNNFWEFAYTKAVVNIVKDFKLDPYTLTIDGLVEKPLTLGLEDIEKLGYEERVYRFRCVEAWSMTVPWLGVPLAKLVALAKPKSTAKYVAFKSFFDPKQAPNQSDGRYKWPYHEGLRIDEAMNELGFVATGAYGKRLLPQSGTPLRIVTPWKYGYKGPKSVVRMTFVDEQPSTFWSAAIPNEYPFYSNVDPQSPHPRWSQAEEKFITDKANVADVEIVPTQWYNGYEEQVGHLYKDMPRKLY